MLAVWNILKDGLTARGIKDWQKILPPKEAIVQEMKRMQAEAQAQKQMKAMPGAEAGMLGQGRPPVNPQVIEMLRQRMGQGARL